MKNITSSLSLSSADAVVSQDGWSREFDRNIQFDSGMVLGGTISF